MTTQATAPSGSVFGQPQFGSGQATGSAFGAPKFGNTSVAGNTFGGQSGSAFGTPSFGSSQKFTAASTANSPLAHYRLMQLQTTHWVNQLSPALPSDHYKIRVLVPPIPLHSHRCRKTTHLVLQPLRLHLYKMARTR